VRQQCRDVAWPVGRQSRKDVLQIGLPVVPVELGRAYRAHDGGSTFAWSRRAGEQPVGPANRQWTYLVFDPVVVFGYVPVIEIVRKRLPVFEAVVQLSQSPNLPKSACAALPSICKGRRTSDRPNSGEACGALRHPALPLRARLCKAPRSTAGSARRSGCCDWRADRRTCAWAESSITSRWPSTSS
jgi:hypothetical protein